MTHYFCAADYGDELESAIENARLEIARDGWIPVAVNVGGLGPRSVPEMVIDYERVVAGAIERMRLVIR